MDRDSFSEYFYTQVLLPYKEFHQSILTHQIGNQRDKQLGFTATVRLYHLKENLPQDISLPFDEIAKEIPSYELSGAIANASKHGKLTNPRWKQLILGNESIKEYIIVCRFEDDKGPYDHVVKSVIVEMVDGTKKELLPELTIVMNMWLELLTQLGLIEEQAMFKIPSVGQVTREEALGLPILTMTKGWPSSFNFLLQRYDYETERFVSEPIKEGKFFVYEKGNPEPVLVKGIDVKSSDTN